VHTVSVNLEPGQYLAGYRPQSASVFVPVLSESRIGDQVAVRVGIYGQTIRATLFGRVSLIRRVGRPALPPGIEMVLDRGSVPAASFLAMAARGEVVTFRERAPRYAVERKLVVEHGATVFETVTLNVAEGGCALRWPGPLPAAGDVVGVKPGSGLFAATARAIVCWTAAGGEGERSLGLRVVVEGRGGRAWRRLVAGIAASGARPA
jgi:hypothetical protein